MQIRALYIAICPSLVVSLRVMGLNDSRDPRRCANSAKIFFFRRIRINYSRFNLIHGTFFSLNFPRHSSRTAVCVPNI